MSEAITVAVPMDYPGKAITKNHLWRRGNRRLGMNPEAKRWRADLAESLRMVLLSERVETVLPPVRGAIGGHFLDRNNAPDLHNLIELVADAVQEATGVDDREHEWRTESPAYNPLRPPGVCVELELAVERRAPGKY